MWPHSLSHGLEGTGGTITPAHSHIIPHGKALQVQVHSYSRVWKAHPLNLLLSKIRNSSKSWDKSSIFTNFSLDYIDCNALPPPVTPLWGLAGKVLTQKSYKIWVPICCLKGKKQIKSTVTEHFCCYSRGQRVQACGHDTHLATHCNNLSKIEPSPWANLPVVPNFPWNVVWKIKYHHCQVQNSALTCHHCYRTALQPLCPKQEGGKQQKWEKLSLKDLHDELFTQQIKKKLKKNQVQKSCIWS